MATRRRDRSHSEETRPSRSGPLAGSSAAGGLGWTRRGLALGLAGILAAVAGLAWIDRGDITVGPVLMVVAYLILLPLALVDRRSP